LSSVRKRKGFERVGGALNLSPLQRRVAHPLGWDVGRGSEKDWIPAFAGMTIVNSGRNDDREQWQE
jgi:hypothetical protein